jgi:hypothetical protein
MEYLVKQPRIITNMMKLNDEYMLLKKRRLTIVSELDDGSDQTLQSLRLDELRILNSHIRKIEHFLTRYGFIARNGDRI